MKYQWLILVVAILVMVGSLSIFIFEKKLDGDYELVQEKGIIGAIEEKMLSQPKVDEVTEEIVPIQSSGEVEKTRTEEGSGEQVETQNNRPSENVPVSETPGDQGDDATTMLPKSETGTRMSAASLELLSEAMVPGLPKLREIPWLKQDVVVAFREASNRACGLLPSGVRVSSSMSPANVEHTLFKGRQTAFTVGLKMDPLARKELPAVSKGTIESYLEDHSLAVQPEIVRTSEGYSFTGAVQCAFYVKRTPTLTVDPEKMISEAVMGFRVLGIFDEAIEGMKVESPGRTLILAFQFNKMDTSLATTIVQKVEEYELLFIHLPENVSGDKPVITAFATADGREKLEQLETLDPEKVASYASIMANIRFEDFKMMGIYPANPIVTGIFNRTVSTMPVETLKLMMVSRDGESTELSRILDRLVN